MPPKEAGPTTWTKEVEVNFLMEIIQAHGGSAPGGFFGELAEKWGAPHTPGSLSKKWSRMNKAWNDGKAKSGDQTPTKRKADDVETEEAAEKTTPKTKKPRTPKTKKTSSSEPASDIKKENSTSGASGV